MGTKHRSGKLVDGQGHCTVIQVPLNRGKRRLLPSSLESLEIKLWTILSIKTLFGMRRGSPCLAMHQDSTNTRIMVIKCIKNHSWREVSLLEGPRQALGMEGIWKGLLTVPGRLQKWCQN